MPLSYRVRQLVRALTGSITAAERRLVEQQLSQGELLLFNRMSHFDQRHCLDVYQTLVYHNQLNPALLRAALLHDCGKVDDAGRPIPLLYYGMFVVLKRIAPGLYLWAARSGQGPLHPFRTHALHEQRSAHLAEQVGCPAAVVTILRDYAARRETPETTMLHWADDRN